MPIAFGRNFIKSSCLKNIVEWVSIFGPTLNCFDGFKEDDFKVQLDGVSIFENPEFDVVKLGVVLTPRIKEINKRLSELPNSNQFPEYKPHITLAYVKRGLGKKYVNPDYKYEIKTISKIVYTRPDTTELNIQLWE